jgi:hypothetical protein
MILRRFSAAVGDRLHPQPVFQATETRPLSVLNACWLGSGFACGGDAGIPVYLLHVGIPWRSSAR